MKTLKKTKREQGLNLNQVIKALQKAQKLNPKGFVILEAPSVKTSWTISSIKIDDIFIRLNGEI